MLVSADEIPQGLLDRVRALLAKAESTTFASEAEAFTAKAQELMTRHRIERALLDRGAEQRLSLDGQRVRIPAPYASAKAVLLAVIADANGCRSIWSESAGVATVFGVPGDVEVVDTLFASLLLQATMSMRRQGSKVDPFGRVRTKRFRRSFLLSFAARIGQRLEETVATTVRSADVEASGMLVPILRDRAQAARDAADTAFPLTRAIAPTVSDGEGWYAGRIAADLVDLEGRSRLSA